MQRRGDAGDAAIEFFRPRRGQITGSQPGLDMHEWQAVIERRQRRGQDARSVALGDDAVGTGRDDRLIEGRYAAAR